MIEDDYPRKGGGFVGEVLGWMVAGLREIPFPAFASLSAELLGMTGPLCARTCAWQVNLDARDPTSEPEDQDLDHRASDAEGLQRAREAKLFLDLFGSSLSGTAGPASSRRHVSSRAR